MALKQLLGFPSKEEINEQFTQKNIARTLSYYNEIKDHYELGDLSEKWYHPGLGWLNGVKEFYPPEARGKFKHYIIEALTNETNGQPDPIPFTIEWVKDGSNPGVTRTYDPYTIWVTGLPGLLARAERERKKTQ